ncbi:MAG: NAD(+) synthase, partial [Syntrophaceticus sp.]
DDAADLAPLLQLYKTQVRALASHLQVPETIISLPPSPDLIAGITDETALGITYAEIDQILAGLEHRVNHQEIAAAVGTTTSVVDSITRHIMAIEGMGL